MANHERSNTIREAASPDQITTIADLIKFKKEIVDEVKNILTTIQRKPLKRWLKSFEAKVLLHISTGTLHNLRTNGTLPFSKIGGIVFYDRDAVEKVLENHLSAK